MKGQIDIANRQIDSFKIEREDARSKYEIASQKISNLERENMKLYKMTIEREQAQTPTYTRNFEDQPRFSTTPLHSSINPGIRAQI